MISLVPIALAACVQEAEQAGSAANAGRIESPGPTGGASAPQGSPDRRVTLARLPDSREGAGAAMPGILRVRQGCVYIEGRDGSLFLLGVTNPDIRWNDGAQALAVGEGLIRDGNAVEVGGAEVSGAARSSVPWREPRPGPCDDTRIWITSAISVR
jgi:hypothetical protein